MSVLGRGANLASYVFVPAVALAAGLSLGRTAYALELTPPSASNAPAASAEATVKDLAAMTPHELRGELAAAEQAARQCSDEIARLRQELWKARQDVKRTNPAVQALRDELDKLKADIERVVDEAPEVQARLAEESRRQAELNVLTERRQSVMALLRTADESDSGAPAGGASAGR